MVRLHLLVIDTGLEAHALRAATEYWRADVMVTWAAICVVSISQQIEEATQLFRSPSLITP